MKKHIFGLLFAVSLLAFIFSSIPTTADDTELDKAIKDVEKAALLLTDMEKTDQAFYDTLTKTRQLMTGAVTSELSKFPGLEQGNGYIRSENYIRAIETFHTFAISKSNAPHHDYKSGAGFVMEYIAQIRQCLSDGERSPLDDIAINNAKERAIKAVSGAGKAGNQGLLKFAAQLENTYMENASKAHELYIKYLQTPNSPDQLWSLADHFSRNELVWFAHERTALLLFKEEFKDDERVKSGECDFRILQSMAKNLEFNNVYSEGRKFYTRYYTDSSFVKDGRLFWLMQRCFHEAQESTFQKERKHILEEMMKKAPEATKNGDYYWDLGETLARLGPKTKKEFENVAIAYNTIRTKYPNHGQVKKDGSGDGPRREADAYRRAGMFKEAGAAIGAMPKEHWWMKQKDRPTLGKFYWLLKIKYDGPWEKSPNPPKK